MREYYRDWNPRAEARVMIRHASEICAEYSAQGFDLTLRQLYYQFVARDFLPNNLQSYKKLGDYVDRARLSGRLDWRYIVDRTRNVYGTDGADETPAKAIELTARGYALPLWENQPYHVEVWVEKEALAGVVARAARTVHVNYFACRGYVSQSEMYSAGQRFKYMHADGKRNVIVHLGDHDPSGIDMTRDIVDRLSMFCGFAAPDVRRIALNMAQIEQYNPPPNFAKQTDTRFEDYQRLYGDESWELDALDPTTLNDLILREVLSFRDEDLWQEAVEHEDEDRRKLQSIVDNWTAIEEAYL